MALPYDVTVNPLAVVSNGLMGGSYVSLPLIEGIAVTTFGLLWPTNAIWYVCSYGVTTSWTSCGAAPSTTWTPC